MTVFRPQKRADRPALRNVKLEVSAEKYDHLQGLAKAAGISLKEFIRQAVDFAVDHHEIIGED